MPEDLSIGKILNEKKYGGMGLISKKTEALYVKLNEKAEGATSSYSTSGDFSRYIYSVFVAKKSKEVPIKIFNSWILFNRY